MKTMGERFRTLLGGGLVLLFSAVAISHAGAQTCVAPPSGLVSWWPGEGDATDIVGGNNGTLQGGVSFAPGKVGQAFNFNGASNSYIVLPNNPNMQPTSNQITIDAWIKPDFSVGNGFDTILAKRDGCSGAGISYILHVAKNGSGLPPGTIHMSMNSQDNSSLAIAQSTIVVPNDGQFHFVAGTYDGTTITSYLDGVPVGTATRSGPIFTTSSAPLISGHGAGCTQVTAVAAIDEVEFFNRALSARRSPGHLQRRHWRQVQARQRSRGGLCGEFWLEVRLSDRRGD